MIGAIIGLIIMVIALRLDVASLHKKTERLSERIEKLELLK